MGFEKTPGGSWCLGHVLARDASCKEHAGLSKFSYRKAWRQLGQGCRRASARWSWENRVSVQKGEVWCGGLLNCLWSSLVCIHDGEENSKENSSRSSRAGPWGSWTDSWLIPCPWCRSPLASASGTIPSQSMAMTGPLLAAGLCLFMSIFEDSLGCSTKGLLPLIRELQGVGLTPKI